MQTLIYAGLRNGARDKAIYEALESMRVIEVAKLYQLSPSTIRAASKRIEKVAVYDLCLVGGGRPINIGQVAADSFRKAALGAYRSYHGTFKNLELPCWKISDGSQDIEVLELRKIDNGEASL